MIVLADEREETRESSSAERRRGLRVHQNRPVKVFEPTIGRYIGGQTEDISATGLRLELPASAPIVPGKLLTVHVGLNHDGMALAHRRNMLPARVVWINRTVGAAKLSAGVEFLASISAHLDAA